MKLFVLRPSLGGGRAARLPARDRRRVPFDGARLTDALELLFYSPGLQSGSSTSRITKFKTTVKIAADCKLGEHAFRVRTASGVSELKRFGSALAGGRREGAEQRIRQAAANPAQLHGPRHDHERGRRLFSVDAKKGQRISVEIEGLRVATERRGNLFDPYIAILDAKRFELATSDDTLLLKQDGCLSIVVPADGKYVIQVRESPTGQRRMPLSATRGHVPTADGDIPAGGKPGDEVEVHFLGDPAGPIKKKIKLPAEREPRFIIHAEDAGGISPSGLPFRVTDLPSVVEASRTTRWRQRPRAQFPGAFNGIIDKPGDIDFYRFPAKKGRSSTFTVTPADSARRWTRCCTFTASRRRLGRQRRQPGSPDSYVRFSVPADGEYLLSVTDHLKKGGPTYVYRVESTPVQPRVDVAVPVVLALSTGTAVGDRAQGQPLCDAGHHQQGRLGRRLALHANGLPAGVKMTAEPMPAYMERARRLRCSGRCTTGRHAG